MTKNDLVVLGLLKEHPMHGYQIKHQIEVRKLDHWAHVSLPSIYNTLNRMEKRGYISAHQEKVGKMPERTVYQLTSKGERQLAKLVEKVLVSEKMPEDNFSMGIAFMYGLDKERVQICLQKKMEILHEHMEQLKNDLRQYQDHIPFNWVYLIRNGLGHLKLELNYLNQLRKSLDESDDWADLMRSRPTRGGQ